MISQKIQKTMIRTSLLERLKPELLESLEKHLIEYPIAINSIKEKLRNNTFYIDLTINDVKMILTFTDYDRSKNVTSKDWQWGEHLFEPSNSVA